MNEIAVYMNAVAVMEDICLHFRQAQDISHTWYLPQYDLAANMVSSQQPQNRFAAWGLQKTIAASIASSFWPIEGTFIWRGSRVGRVSIAHRGQPSEVTAKAYAPNTTLAVPDNDLSTTATNATIATSLQAGHQIELVPAYSGGLRLTASQIFSTALAVMVAADEHGLDTPCTGIWHSDIQVVPELDRRAQPLLEWRQLIKSMRLLTRWMVAQNRFEEIQFDILRDGTLIARGKLKLPGPFGVTAAE